jgi:hypothetical protein
MARKSALSLALLFASAHLAAQSDVFLRTGPGPYHIAAGDLNGDGTPDLVVPCRGDLLSPELPQPANDTISVFLSDEHGQFAEARSFTVGFGPYTAAIGDLDGDTIPDVVVANFQSNDGRDLAILYGAPDRGHLFEPARYIRTAGGDFRNDKSLSRTGNLIYATPGLTSVALGDFNRDGRLDMVAVAWTSDFFVIYLNTGNRSFEQHRYPLPPGPRDVVVGDFDGDGLHDLAITLYSSNMVQVWKGDGHGRFNQWREFHSAGQVPYHVKSGDLDGDGRLDLVVGNRGVHDNVTVFRNTEDRFMLVGSFSPGTPKKGETTADEIRDVYLRDLDGDGKLDLVAACHISHKVVVWKGSGDLRFGKAFRDPKVAMYPGKGPRAIATAGAKMAIALFDSNELVIFDFAN